MVRNMYIKAQSMDTQNLNPAAYGRMAYGVCMRASSRMSEYSTIEINVLLFKPFRFFKCRF